jgi:hypothetical protein
VRTFSQHIERNLYPRRILARMFVALGPLPLGLVAIGDWLAARARAASGRVILQIIRENLIVITCGAAIGWVLAFAISVHAITTVLLTTAEYPQASLITCSRETNRSHRSQECKK